MGPATLYTLGNTTLALAGVVLVVSRPDTAWLLVVLTIAMLGAYRATERERQKHQTLTVLHEATREIEGAVAHGGVTDDLLRRARELLGGRRAEFLLLPESDSGPAQRTRLSEESGTLVHETVEQLDPTEGVWARVAAEGESVRVTARSASDKLRAYLEREGISEMLAAPVPGETGTAAVLMVADHHANVGSWRAEDLTILETLANHAGVALRNGLLLARLEARAAENEHVARHDALTGLPNRSSLERLFTEAIELERPVAALLLMDLDGFKEINDTLGHANGDRILRELASRLKGALGADHILARLSGDEFCVICFGSDAEGVARMLARRIQECLEEPFSIDELQLRIGGSIGGALHPRDGADAGTLLRHADVAMYLAKEARSEFELYAPERDEYHPARLALAGDLHRAIERGELEVWYQPQEELSGGRVVGAEALVRWRHPTRGLITPDSFIPVVEQTNLLRPMTLCVITEAVGRCAAWRSEGFDLHVSVNLSARNLLDPGLAAEVAEILGRSGLPPSALTLEITESAVMSDRAAAETMLSDLRALGVGISIDDYGTGQSSLAYLKHLPVTELKIDRSFVVDLDVDQGDRAIVRSTIALGHELGLRVVAEGVETEAVRALISGYGCDLAQGWLLGRALSPADFDRFLAHQPDRRAPFTTGRRDSPPRRSASPRRSSSARRTSAVRREPRPSADAPWFPPVRAE